MNNAINAVLAIVGGVIGLAIVSVLIAPRAQTGKVLTAAGGALSSVIGAAVSPVTGQPVPYSYAGGMAQGGFGGGTSAFDIGDGLDIAAKVAPYFL